MKLIAAVAGWALACNAFGASPELCDMTSRLYGDVANARDQGIRRIDRMKNASRGEAF